MVCPESDRSTGEFQDHAGDQYDLRRDEASRHDPTAFADAPEPRANVLEEAFEQKVEEEAPQRKGNERDQSSV